MKFHSDQPQIGVGNKPKWMTERQLVTFANAVTSAFLAWAGGAMVFYTATTQGARWEWLVAPLSLAMSVAIWLAVCQSIAIVTKLAPTKLWATANLLLPIATYTTATRHPYPAEAGLTGFLIMVGWGLAIIKTTPTKAGF